MANQLERKLTRIFTDDFGLAPSTTLNLGQDITEHEGKNVDRAVKILKKNANLTDYVQVGVKPSDADPKAPELNFGDFIVDESMRSKQMSVGKEEQERLLKRFSESGGKPFSMAVKANKEAGVQIPLISDKHIGSTLGRKTEKSDAWLVPNPVYTWMNQPSSNWASGTLRGVVGGLAGEGPIVRGGTEAFQDWAGNKTVTNFLGSAARKAAPVGTATAIYVGREKAKMQSEQDKKISDDKAIAERVGGELEFEAIKKVLGGKETDDARFLPNSGKIAKVPFSFQNEVWEKVRSGIDPNKRTTSVYKMPADKVMEKFNAVYDYEGQNLRWERSTGRVENGKRGTETIPKSSEWADSAEPRLLSPSYVMDPSDKKYGIKAKPDDDGKVKRYVGAIVDMGTASLKKSAEAAKKARTATTEADPEKSDLSKTRTLKDMLEESKKDSSQPRYKWVFFEVGGGKSGTDAIYLDKDGKLGTPDFE